MKYSLHKYATLNILLILICYSSLSYWSPIPSPEGGFVSQLLYHNNEMYAVAPGSGIYLSSNNGDNWHQITKNNPYLRVIRYISNDANTIFAATYQYGIFKTTDKGNKWNMILDTLVNGAPYTPRKIINFKSDILILSNIGIINSTDNGTTWNLNNSGLPKIDFLDLTDINNTFFLGSNKGLFKSTDYAQNWQLTGFQDVITYKVFRSGNRLFVCTYDTNTTSGPFFNIFEGDEEGIIWNKFHESIFSNSQILAFNELNTQWVIKTLKIVDSIGISSVYQSTDKGGTWNLVYKDSTHYTTKFTSGLSQSPGFIFIGSRFDGIKRKSDALPEWTTKNNGIYNNQITSITSKQSIYFSGTLENGVYSSDAQFNWRLLLKSPLLNQEMFKRINKVWTNGNIVFAGTSQGIFSTNNNGLDWTDLGLNNYEIMDIDSLNGKIYAFGNYKIGNLYAKGDFFVSDNFGQTWNIISIPENQYISAMLIKNKNIFLGTYNGLLNSIDDGKTWKYADRKFIDSLTILSIVQTNNNFLCATLKGMFISTDNGQSWKETKTGLKTKQFSKLISTGLYCLAISDKGVYLSLDHGLSWQEINKGLNNLDMIEINNISDDIYVVPAGDCIYKSSIQKLFPLYISNIPAEKFCPEMSFRVEYAIDTTFVFNADNTFTVQLSDSSGDFSSIFYNLGSAKAKAGGTIDVTLPKDIPNSSHYRIRIISSNPPSIGCDNLKDLSIIKVLKPSINGNLQSCEGKTETYSIIPTQGFKYKWNVNNGTISGDSTQPNVTIRWGSVGNAKLTAYQYNSEQCFDSSTVAIQIYSNPAQPTITKQDSFLITDADKGIQWYLNDQIITGANAQKFKPSNSGKYTVSVTNSNGCSSLSAPYTYDNSDDFTYLKIDNKSGSPGDQVNVYIRLNKGKDFANYNISNLNGVLEINSSILYPEESNKGTVVGSSRYIQINLDTNYIAENVIRSIPLKVMLGNSLISEIKLTNLKNNNIPVNIPIRQGKFNLTGVCLEGGPRLISSAGTVVINSIVPNPAKDKITINYESLESGNTVIYIINSRGETVKTLFSGDLSPGKHQSEYTVKDLTSGEYYVIMQTNSLNVMSKLIISK